MARRLPGRFLPQIWNALFQLFSDFMGLALARFAAGLAFYTIFSLAPILVISVAVAGFFIGAEAATEEITRQVESAVGDSAAEVTRQALTAMQQMGGRGIALAGGLIFLLLGASQVFLHLQWSMNYIWSVEPHAERSLVGEFLHKRLLSFGLLLASGFLLLISVTLTASLAWMARNAPFAAGLGWLLQLVDLLVWLSLVAALLAVLYKILPDVWVRFSDTWEGAVGAAVGLALMRYLLGLYLSQSIVTNSYGAAGSLVVLLVYVYWSAQIVFLGALYCRQHAHRSNRMPVPYASATYVMRKAARPPEQGRSLQPRADLTPPERGAEEERAAPQSRYEDFE